MSFINGEFCRALAIMESVQPIEPENKPLQGRYKYSLSVIVITKNEADRIDNCLSSVQEIADEIIVIDSGSSDETCDIARRYTDKVFVADWPGYGIQRQRALERARGDWVLSIDADEALDSKLREEIVKVLKGDYSGKIAYKLPWGVVAHGKRLRFGRSARAPLRLFKRAGAKFTDSKVHEKVILPQGKVGKLKGVLLHYTHRDFGHALYKNAHYAWLGAQVRYEKGIKGGGLVGATLRAIWTFLVVYIFRGGFLDGGAGYVTAVLYAQGSFNKYAGLWALRRGRAQASLGESASSPATNKGKALKNHDTQEHLPK